MDYGENRNETHVPVVKLQGVIGAKQIGGLLEYRKMAGGFRSCTIIKSRSKYWSIGAWLPLFAGLRNTKDFTVASVGDSDHKVLQVSLHA